MRRPVRSTLPGQISLEVAPIRSERPADLRDPSLKMGGGGISNNRVTFFFWSHSLVSAEGTDCSCTRSPPQSGGGQSCRGS